MVPIKFCKKKKKNFKTPGRGHPGILNPLSVSRLWISIVHLKAFAPRLFTFWGFPGGPLYWRYPGKWTQGLHFFGVHKMSPETMIWKFWTIYLQNCSSYLNLTEIREESCMGGTRSYGPILLVHELDLTFLKIWPETKFHCPSYKFTQVIVVADRQTDGQTDRQTDRRTDIAQTYFFVILCNFLKDTYSRKRFLRCITYFEQT